MTRKATDRSERIAPVLAFVLTVLLSATQAQAQPGSTGGNIGQQGKSVSGGDDPPSRKASRQKTAKPKASAPRRAARTPVDIESQSASIHGLWRWSAACERGQRNYNGTMTIEQSGSGLKLSHGGTNFWDGGTVTNVRYTGSQLSFDRQFAHFKDHAVLSIARGGARMSGVIPSTEHSGRCQLSFVKS